MYKFSSLCIIAAALLFTNTMAQTNHFSQTLTSVERNIHLDTWQISNRDFKDERSWSVQKYTLHGGKQEGVDLIVVNNGKLTFSVIPTRGMGIAKVVMGDVTLGWNSPVKEIVHPNFINLESRGGLGWLEGFNEMMVRCGLEWAGHPGKDKFINNTGDEAEMDLTVHGKIGNTPASEVEVIIDENHRIRIRGRVDERMFYGPKLELWTEISTEPMSGSFRIEDTIKNYSAYESEFQIIYHANYGPPLLEKGSQFVAAVKEIRPFNSHAAKSLNQYADYAAPTKGFVEQVYGVIPFTDAKNSTSVMLHNPAADKAVMMNYDTATLPYFTLWKNTSAIEEGYVTGLEPATGFPSNRSIERKAGRVPKLKPNESRKFTLEISILNSKEQVQQGKAQIAALQAGKPTKFNPELIRPE